MVDNAGEYYKPKKACFEPTTFPPLLQKCDMSEDAKRSAIEVCVTATEIHPDYEQAAKAIKRELDRLVGPIWNVVVGEAYGLDFTHQVGGLLYLYCSGNLGVCCWRAPTV